MPKRRKDLQGMKRKGKKRKRKGKKGRPVDPFIEELVALTVMTRLMSRRR